MLLVARPLESSSLLHPPLLEASTLPQCSWQRKPRHHLSPTYAECCLLPSGAYNWRSGFPQPGVRLQSSDQLQIWVSLMPPCGVGIGIGIGIRLCVVSASGFWSGFPLPVRTGPVWPVTGQTGPVRFRFVKIQIWIKKRKIPKKILKILQGAINLMVLNFLKNLFV